MSDLSINTLKQRLHGHRQTLQHLLRQAAAYGGLDLAPPVTWHGVRDARDGIADCKSQLRALGVAVDDEPSDAWPDGFPPELSRSVPPAAASPVTLNQSGNVNFGYGNTVGSVTIHQTTWGRKVLLVLSALLLMLSLGAVWYLFLRPPAMMRGGWNVAIAGFDYEDASGVSLGRTSSGEDFSDRLFRAIQLEDGDRAGWRREDGGVGFITGTPQQRLQQAAAVAEQTNAAVVVYGIIRAGPGPGRETVELRLHIRQERRDPAFFGLEVALPDTFGPPLSYTTGTLRETDFDPLSRRLERLSFFLDALRHYYAAAYPQARSGFCTALLGGPVVGVDPCTALRQNEPADQGADASVIWLYLGALELVQSDQPDYAAALTAYTHAHALWPDYGRPFLGMGTLFYLQAHRQFEQGRILESPSSMVDTSITCFGSVDNGVLAAPPFEVALRLARRCYEEALAAPVQPANAELELKVRFGLASVLLLHLQQEPNDLIMWAASRKQLEQAIAHYEASEVEIRERYTRLAGHLYARRGLWIVCYPDCKQPQGKSLSEYQQAAQDYARAVSLLRAPAGCAEDLDLCYPDDLRWINVYQAELINLNQALERAQEIP